jgi:predicted nucleic acid-binding protein
MNVHCFDTSALLEITHDGPHAAKFEKALAKAESVIISSISIYEMARYLTRVSGETITEQVLAFLQQYHISPVTTEIAALAAALGARYKLAMADSLIYATALSHHATLWTQDADFKGLPHVKYFPKVTAEK